MNKRTKKRKTAKANPFPMELFEDLLRRYCREHFSKEDVEEHASYTSPYLGVCIGDDNGSLNHPIIEAGNLLDG